MVRPNDVNTGVVQGNDNNNDRRSSRNSSGTAAARRGGDRSSIFSTNSNGDVSTTRDGGSERELATNLNRSRSVRREEATGCNLVQPFFLRDDIQWKRELGRKEQKTNDDGADDDGDAAAPPPSFSFLTWSYTASERQNKEFIRFEYRSLVLLVTYIFTNLSNWFLAFAALADGGSAGEFGLWGTVPGTLVVIFFATSMAVLTCLDLFAHLRRSAPSANSAFWGKIRRATQVMLLLNVMVIVSGPIHFWTVYERCSELLRDGFTGATISTEQDVRTYCKNSPGGGFFVAAFVIYPLLTNLSFPAIVFYSIAQLISEVVSRPVALLFDGYATPETTEVIIIKILAWAYCATICLLISYFRSAMSRKMFEQAVYLELETQIAVETEEQVDLLLCATVPASALHRLTNGEPCSDYTEDATVLFSDMVSFTAWSSSRTPQGVIQMLNTITEALDREAARTGVEKIKTIGDAYWAVCGIPEVNDFHAETMCKFGLFLNKTVKEGSKSNPSWGPIQFRVGIHSGPLYGGILGTKSISYEVFGETSDIATSIEQGGIAAVALMSRATALSAGFSLETLDPGPRIGNLFSGTSNNTDTTSGGQGGDIRTYRLPKSFFGDETLSQASSGGASGGKDSIVLGGSAHGSLMSKYSSEAGVAVQADKDAKKRRKAFLQQRAVFHEQKRLRLLEEHTEEGADSAKSAAVSLPLHHQPEENSSPLGAEGPSEFDKTSSKHGSAPTVVSTEINVFSRFNKTSSSCRQDFALDDVETDYQRFISALLGRVGFACRALILAFPLLVLLTYSFDNTRPNGNEGLGTLTSILFGISIIIGAINLLLHYRNTMLLRGDGPRPGTMMILDFVGTSLSMIASYLSPEHSAVLVNDPSFTSCFLPLLVWGSVGRVPSLFLVLALVLVFTPVYAISITKFPVLSGLILYVVQQIASFAFLSVVTERSFRQMFVESRLALRVEQEQRDRLIDQDALLRSIVPEYIIPKLFNWLSTDMKLPLVHSYSNMTVAFVTLLPPPRRQAESSFAVPQPPQNPGSVEDENPGCVQTGAMSKEVAQPRHVKDDEEEEYWLSAAIERFDTLIDKFPALTKVKVIGSTVMLAGPFVPVSSSSSSRPPHHGGVALDSSSPSSSSPANPLSSLNDGRGSYQPRAKNHSDGGYAGQGSSMMGMEYNLSNSGERQVPLKDLGAAVSQLISLNVDLKKAFTGETSRQVVIGGSQCGIHCGPLVGGIQGTSRLCYDIFGDTVNVASRVLTGARKLRSEEAATSKEVDSVTLSSFTALSQEAVRAFRAHGSSSSDSSRSRTNTLEAGAASQGEEGNSDDSPPVEGKNGLTPPPSAKNDQEVHLSLSAPQQIVVKGKEDLEVSFVQENVFS